MPDLKGARVALLEARMSSELASLVERNGGNPYSVPAVREQELDAGEQVAEFVRRITAGEFQIVIFLTGVGARRLFEAADRLGSLQQLFLALKDVTKVCRGPKPVAVLRKAGLQIDVTAREPHTTNELLEALEPFELSGTGIALQHYGERNVHLAEALEARGAALTELTLYEWQLPEDIEPLRRLVEEIIAGSVDVVAFTSQIQVRNLFKVARDINLDSDLARALKDKTLVASIGPTCTSALHEFGVDPDVVPDHPKMGPLILALAAYLEKQPR
jgi:uroporphyrinogen-III synthase